MLQGVIILLIAERKLSFDVQNAPSRDGRNLVIWTLNDIAAFIGHAVIDGRLEILEEETEIVEEDEPDLFRRTRSIYSKTLK